MRTLSFSLVLLLTTMASIAIMTSAQSPCASNLIISVSFSDYRDQANLEDFKIFINDKYIEKTGLGGTLRVPLNSRWKAGNYEIEAFKQDESGCYSGKIEKSINPCNQTTRGESQQIEIQVRRIQCNG